MSQFGNSAPRRRAPYRPLARAASATKIVTLYNQKGGVSKTTTTFNLAHALAEFRGKRVLLVDADPQCNLTELCLARTIEQFELDAEAGGALQDLPGTTILAALNPRFQGERPDVDVPSIQLVHPDPNVEVHLLRGDISLNEAEDVLSDAHSRRTTTDIHQRRNYVAIHDMLRRLGAERKFDYVLVDVGPSAGALTRTCFLAADMFLVPVAPDRFNFQAIGSLSKIIAKWIREHAAVVDDFQELGLNIAHGKPQFRGLIVQRYLFYAGKPKPGFRIWMERIPENARTSFIPALIEAAGTRDIVFPACLANPTAVQIQEFASLAPMMLTFSKPVWRLTQDDTGWVGNVWEQAEERMKDIRGLFGELAARVDA